MSHRDPGRSSPDPADSSLAPRGQGQSLDGELSRSDFALIQRALRQDWPIPADVKKRILQRVVDYLDPETEEGATAPDRTVLIAARTLASFMKLNLGQQALDLARAKFEGRKNDVTLAELVQAAERRAQDRKRDRD